MKFGVHLPLIGFTDEPLTLRKLLDVADASRNLGFAALSANDHLIFARPWLDGLTALAAVVAHSDDLKLATTVALPVVRGPVALAKTAAALDVLSEGRLILGVGPGSSARDYAAVGLDFEERWHRLEEAVWTLRGLLDGGPRDFHGRYYSTAGLTLEPRPHQSAGIPIWIGSWGSDAGLRRVARLGDGWLSSAYNTTPQVFAEAWGKLRGYLEATGRDGASFPNAVATALLYISDDPEEARRVLRRLVSPALNRPPEQLAERLLIGRPAEISRKLSEYRDAGLQMVYLWPVADETAQLERFAQEIMPQVDEAPANQGA